MSEWERVNGGVENGEIIKSVKFFYFVIFIQNLNLSICIKEEITISSIDACIHTCVFWQNKNKNKNVSLV